ncbi:DUF7065 domain-containing protein [Mycolicibacterium peregrinum]|uniref:DUF7065 domain-containing protein n=1 Tax=Mycolicibacterium peregrinum TaxID=43304 RepID=UPI000AFFDBEA|nr:hypothetical protein [Mycolicibacterium peregrinum]
MNLHAIPVPAVPGSEDFAPSDDGLHESGSEFYFNETYWFSFFAPERGLGGWLYSGIRPNAGVTTGGCWIWDSSGTDPWEIPFFEQFNWLKPPTSSDAHQLVLPNGNTVTTAEPGQAYDLVFDDRDRLEARLRFTGTERPVPLRPGTPPYPKASHFDQTGHVGGHLLLDGQRIDIDCYAMRDRSWGPRRERGYRPMAYTWLADAHTSLLTYATPDEGRDGTDSVYAGYLRRNGAVGYLVSGVRQVRRDPRKHWITDISIDVIDGDGRPFSAHGRAVSRMILPTATSVCVNSLMAFTVDGTIIHGEDQDVWPMNAWRTMPGT